jgi:hypothetical protein
MAQMKIGSHRENVWSRTVPTGGRSNTVELNQRLVVFAGHGSYASITDAGVNEFFTVPRGVRIVFWCLHGNAFAGSDLDRRMHTNDFGSTKFDWDPDSNTRGLGTGLPEMYSPGSLCRNYRLTPPVGITLGNDDTRDKRFILVSDRGPLNIGHRLSDLLTQHWNVCNNATVHWAACRSVKAR